ncbi:hypothetical protein OS175_11595 [Marinicella sp. S1101]|uniref:hypothetical protein n=1 Tax=Marinicella marina TaxID=2996016 RepID=UPI002260BE6A|nr:hypothetical protein [Marinicella marina]MCX7554528.1 hypothetical protein [Marinicella marina]MDJ1141088.1 hypothetical protein [Marinicella marina]
MEIGKTYSDIHIDELNIKKTNDTYKVTFSFIDSGNNITTTLIGVWETYNLCEILDADRIWIKRTDNKQAEFGKYRLGISHESFFEIEFDQIEI